MLGLADFTSEVAENGGRSAISGATHGRPGFSMRRCQAGIIAVTVDEGRKDGDGNYVLNENVLIEIGAAFVLYERRVVLVWDKRSTSPRICRGSTGANSKATSFRDRRDEAHEGDPGVQATQVGCRPTIKLATSQALFDCAAVPIERLRAAACARSAGAIRRSTTTYVQTELDYV